MPCNHCTKRRQSNTLPDKQIEFTSKSIKEGRRKYAKSALQPRRRDEPSREFIEAYPKEAQETFTEKEIKHAKNVWGDIPSIRNWRQTS